MSDLISREAAIAAIEGLNHGAIMVRAKKRVTDRALSAVRALPAAPAVKVKPLVWRMAEIGCDTGYNWHEMAADTPFGLLRIRDHTPFTGKVLFSYGYGDYHGQDETPYSTSQEEAKAAAQSDYESRILSALEGGAA